MNSNLVNYNISGLYEIVNVAEQSILNRKSVTQSYKRKCGEFDQLLSNLVLQNSDANQIFYIFVQEAMIKHPFLRELDVESYFYTFLWVIDRIPTLSSWRDLMSILDYISRVHANMPFVKLMVDFALLQFSELQAQSWDWSVLKMIFNNYTDLKNHPVVVKVIKVVTLAFSGGFLRSIGVEFKCLELWDVITQGFGTLVGHADFFSACIDLVYFIGERISSFLMTGDWKTFLHSPSNYKLWVDSAYDLIDRSTTVGNPMISKEDYHTYTRDVEKAITLGVEIRKYLKLTDEKDSVSFVLSRLKSIYNDILIARSLSAKRIPPFAALIYAGSGVGKSTFLDIMLAHYAKLFNKPLDDEFIYVRTAAEEHWNSFKSFKWACILDDIASIKPVKASSDPSLADLLQANNYVGFSPPQAALEDKGKTPFMCELLLATTNTKNLMAHSWFNNPQAIVRRLPFVVTIVPKMEYRKPESNCLDHSKVPVLQAGMYPDLWDILVEEVKVNRDETVTYVPILETDSIYKFILCYNEWVEKHRSVHASIVSSKDQINNVQLCLVHKLPYIACGCELLQPQVLEDCFNTFVSNCATLGGAYCAFKTMEAISTGTVSDCVENVRNTIVTYTRQTVYDYIYGKLITYMKGKCPATWKIVVGLTFLSVGGLGLYKIFKDIVPPMEQQQEEINIDDFGKTPITRNEPENVWRKDDYQPSRFLGRLSSSWKDLELSQVCSIVSRNVVWIQISHSDSKKVNFRAFCVGGHLYCAPNHVMPYVDQMMVQVICDNATEGCNGNVRFMLHQTELLRMADKELVFFEILHMPIRRDLINLLPKQGYRFDGRGRMIIRNPNGSVDYNDISRVNSIFQYPVPNLNLTLDIASCNVSRDTVSGECGSPVIVKQPNGYTIAGLHCLGGTQNKAVAVMVTYEDIQKYREHLETFIVDCDMPDLKGQVFSTDISSRCTARFVESGDLEVFGSFCGFKRQPKSTGTATPFTEYLLRDGHTLDYGPAPMKGYIAVHKALKDMVQKENVFDVTLLKSCGKSYAMEVINGLPFSFLEEMSVPLSLEATLNGVPGLRFIDSMNFNTSAGFPYNRSKQFFIEHLPSYGQWQHPVAIKKEIRDDVEMYLKKMRQGISCAPVFTQHLKDEILPIHKVKNGLARVFMGAPFAWCVCVRMHLLPFIRVMQINKYLFECAPGMNTTSVEWHRLYQYLREYGEDTAIAGDFKSFDKSMGSAVILIAFKCIITILKKANCSEQHLLAVQTIAEDIAFCFCNYNGDLMRFFGSNPSGHPLTVIINCIVNSIYMRYVYAKLKIGEDDISGSDIDFENALSSFRSDVRLITYGDDNAMTSKVSWFNHTSVATELAKVGIKYTMADKSEISIPFLRLSQISFLKRSFRYDNDLKCYTGPLDRNSIWKSLLLCIPSDCDTREKQALDIVRSAVAEWFFHGRDEFETQVKYLKRMVTDVGLMEYCEDNIFLPWDKLCDRFMDNSLEYLQHEPQYTKELLGDISMC